MFAHFWSASEFELTHSSFSDLDHHNHIDIILLGNQRGQNLCDVGTLKVFHPDAQIIAIGPRRAKPGRYPLRNRTVGSGLPFYAFRFLCLILTPKVLTDKQ